MHLFSCEHPTKVINPYNGETLFIPCGKCHICLAKKANDWVERLEIERSSHPYCLFGTLTYQDKFLPTFNFVGNGFVDFNSGEFISYDDLETYLDYESINFINSRGCLPCGSVLDCQRFIKRLRDCVRRGTCGNLPSSEDRPEDRYIRYFLVEELGETTLRPHYHFLIFSASKWFAEHAKDVVAACWRTDSRYTDSQELGIIDVQNVQSSASSYVAQYVNSYLHCPKIYQFKRFRPFKIFSKAPAIGSFVTESKEIKELFYSGSVFVDLYRRKTNEYVHMPLPKSLYTRLYPKVVGFDRFNTYVLRGLYTFSSQVSTISYQEFNELIRKRAFRVFDGVSEYFRWLLDNTTEKESNIKSTFSVLRRVSHQSRIFGVSTNYYFDRILDFYSKQDYERLRSKFDTFEQNNTSLSFQLLTDLAFVDRIANTPLKEVTNHDKLILNSYGWNEDEMSLTDFLETLDFTSDKDYVDLLSKSKKQIDDNRKTKAKNEYLEYRQKDRKFMNFLIDYHLNKNGL